MNSESAANRLGALKDLKAEGRSIYLSISLSIYLSTSKAGTFYFKLVTIFILKITFLTHVGGELPLSVCARRFDS